MLEEQRKPARRLVALCVPENGVSMAGFWGVLYLLDGFAFHHSGQLLQPLIGFLVSGFALIASLTFSHNLLVLEILSV